jgi:hypothetical protein
MDGAGLDSAEAEAADRALSSVARKLDTSMSVEYTVNDLIATATDPANLSQLFVGTYIHFIYYVYGSDQHSLQAGILTFEFDLKLIFVCCLGNILQYHYFDIITYKILFIAFFTYICTSHNGLHSIA